MDTKLCKEIISLKNAKKLYQTTYVTNLEELQVKLERLNNQTDRCGSDVKREILERQRTLYENEIQKIDVNIENTTKFIDKKIEKLETQLNKEKKSVEYNIDKLKKALERRNVNEIFDMFECVSNALTTLNDEVLRTPGQP